MSSFFSRIFGTETRSSLENPSTPLSAPAAWLMDWLGGGRTDSNERVSEMTALEVPTVIACVTRLSEGVGTLPLRIYKELERGRVDAKDHFLWKLLTKQPNPEQTAADFFTTLMTHAVLWQNAYVQIQRNGAGKPVALWLRTPWKTQIKQGKLGVVYESTDTVDHQQIVFKSEDCIHIRGFSLDGWSGTSLIHLVRQQIGLSLAATRYSARFYANNGRPGGIIKTQAPITPEDLARMRTDFEALQSGANTHRIAILQSGLDWVEVGIKPVDAQHVEQLKFSKEEIASIFHVPGYMVGILDKALKSTVEQQSQEWLSYSLRPWMVRIEQAFTSRLLPDDDTHALAYFTNELLKANYTARMNGYAVGRQAGIYSANDCRAMENLPPIEGGDVYLSPLNMTPTDHIKPITDTNE